MDTIDNALNGLNPAQKDAVLRTDGPLLILAGAGSGKTRVITTRAAYLIAQGVPPERILAVTFTNKAADEMKERVRALAGGLNGKKPFISTFHSLCARILRREIEILGYGKNFAIYDASEQASILRNLLSEVQVHDKAFRPDDVMEYIGRFKNTRLEPKKEMLDPSDIEGYAGMLYPKYQDALKGLNALDFDDLLIQTLRLFREHKHMLEKYSNFFKYVMVDEYQDTNRTQYELMRLLSSGHGNICVVGDDDQSIYSWRGADIRNILDFQKDFPGAKVVRLEQNYRSTGNILSAANSVISNNSDRMPKTLWSESPGGQRPKLFTAEDSEAEAEWVADRISLIKYELGVPYEHFAVIYRANALSKPFEEALRMSRIPYTVVGGMSYFDRKEIKDIAAYLKLIANAKDDLSLLRAVGVPKRGIGLTTLKTVSEYARARNIGMLQAFSGDIPGLSPRQLKPLKEFSGLMRKYSGLADAGTGMADSVRGLIAEIGYHDFIRESTKNRDMAQKRIENVGGFIESVRHYESAAEAPTLTGFLESMALLDMNRDDKDKSVFGVTLTSFHSAKGLEFPVVFIAGMDEDIMPHKKSSGDSGLEEERRLFYVGITRAMRELYITHTQRRIRYGKSHHSNPSRFIGEIPDSLLEKAERAKELSPEENARRARVFFSRMKDILKDKPQRGS